MEENPVIPAQPEPRHRTRRPAAPHPGPNGSGLPSAPEPLPPALYPRGPKLVLADGREYTFAPLTFGQMERAGDLFERVLNATNWFKAEDRSALVDLVHMVLQRNYPPIQKAEVVELLDFECMPDVLEAIWGLNSFRELRRRLGIPSP